MAFEFAAEEGCGLAASGVAGRLGADKDEVFVRAGAEGDAGGELVRGEAEGG